MKRNNNSNARSGFRLWPAKAELVASIVLGTLLGVSSYAADMFSLSPTPGGVPAQSTITSITVTPTNATLCWYGMRGWYTVEMSTNLPTYTPVGSGFAASEYAWCATVTNNTGSTNGVFFRLNQNNGYVGQGACAGCHGDKFEKYQGTEHYTAYNLITNLTGAAYTNELPYHTVGYGQPSGFTTASATPQLKNVGCENCHGPAGWHKYSEHTLLKPAVTYYSEVCAGCHSSPGRDQYNEWLTMPHSRVTPAEVTSMGSQNILSGSSEVGSSGRSTQLGCGKCHSGAIRLTLLDDWKARQGITNIVGGVTNITAAVNQPLVLPSTHDATNCSQTCVTCHDPHDATRPFQLRWPLASTNFMDLTSGSTISNIISTNVVQYWSNLVLITVTNKATNTYYWGTTFATNYNPNVQVCGQCHHARGANWTSSSRPPHAASQYNMFIGALQPGYLNGTNAQPGLFGLGTNGCTQCHMVNADHTFEFNPQGMVNAGWYADTNAAEAAVDSMQETTTNLMNEVITLLNTWSATKAPLITNKFTNYYNAWEYSSEYPISNPTGTNRWSTPWWGTNSLIYGPSSTYQALIPVAIQKARFNLYYVRNDASKGVHNIDYVTFLLNDAKTNINSLLP